MTEGTAETPSARLRKLISREYRTGKHNGRPVVVSSGSDDLMYLDDPIGLAAWRYRLLHEKRLIAWWSGMTLAEAEELVVTATLRERIDTSEHGREIGLADPEHAALVDLADRRGWEHEEVTKLYRGQAMVGEIRELIEEQTTTRAMVEAADGFTWTNLADDWDDEPLAPAYLRRTDGYCGLYPAQRNLVVGYTESGKTWMELFTLAQEIRAGRPVVLLDHENGEAVIRSRLRALGLDRDQVKDLLRYRYLTVPLPPEFANELARELWSLGSRLVMVDALTPVAEALGHDLSGGNVNGVEQVYRTVLDPWVMVGFAGVMLDNTGKRDRSATSGSQHKEAGIGGSVLSVVSEAKSAKGRAGRSKVFVNKDRSGSVPFQPDGDDDKRLFGTMHVRPGSDEVLDVFIDAPPEPDPVTASTVSIAAVVDIVHDTCELIAESIRKHGVTEVSSMRRLATMMGTVHYIDPAKYPAAHLDRERIRDCLMKVATPDDWAAAGIGVDEIKKPRSTSYRVWLT